MLGSAAEVITFIKRTFNKRYKLDYYAGAGSYKK
jgi:hypothetical protein